MAGHWRKGDITSKGLTGQRPVTGVTGTEDGAAEALLEAQAVGLRLIRHGHEFKPQGLPGQTLFPRPSDFQIRDAGLKGPA